MITHGNAQTGHARTGSETIIDKARAAYNNASNAAKVATVLIPVALGGGVAAVTVANASPGGLSLSQLTFGLACSRLPSDPPSEKEMELAKKAELYNAHTAKMAFETNRFRSDLQARWKVDVYRNGPRVSEGGWNDWQKVPEARQTQFSRPGTTGEFVRFVHDRAFHFETPSECKAGDMVVIYGQAANGSEGRSPVSTAILMVVNNGNALTHNMGKRRDVDGDGVNDHVAAPIAFKGGTGEALGTPKTFSLENPNKLQRSN